MSVQFRWEDQGSGLGWVCPDCLPKLRGRAGCWEALGLVQSPGLGVEIAGGGTPGRDLAADRLSALKVDLPPLSNTDAMLFGQS